MTPEQEISGKTFIITGAAAGLGAAFAKAFLQEGAKHIAILDVSEEAGLATVSRLTREFGAGAASFVRCDVSEEVQLSAAYDAVTEERGAVDVVINNAGIFEEGKQRKMIEINLMAVVSSSYRAFEMMRKDRGGAGGTIVNVSSMAAFAANHLMPVYAATKSAVVSFSNSLGLPVRYKDTGVRVLVICYGPTETEMVKNTEKREYDEETARDSHLIFKRVPIQSVESATRGMLEMFRRSASGSTWFAACDQPVRDVTGAVGDARRNLLQTSQ